MLPRQARSMSSHQLQMQRQLSQVGWLHGWTSQTVRRGSMLQDCAGTGSCCSWPGGPLVLVTTQGHVLSLVQAAPPGQALQRISRKRLAKA